MLQLSPPPCTSTYTYVNTHYVFLQWTKKEPWSWHWTKILSHKMAPDLLPWWTFPPFSEYSSDQWRSHFIQKKVTRLQSILPEGLSALKPPPTLCYSSLGLLTSWANRKLCLLKITSKQGNSTAGRGKGILGGWVFFSVFYNCEQVWVSPYSLLFLAILCFLLHYCQCIMLSGIMSPCSSYKPIRIQQIVRNLVISNVAWGFPSTCFIASD